ncbi:MAG: hypothetical protein NC923_03155 [Candidatus Omnitrophica bacterium]|nr:hypothetical protein [Candidatus Omnitrophota bacterium]
MRLRFIYYWVVFIVFTCIYSTSLGNNVIEVDQAKVRLVIAPGKAKAGAIRVYNPTTESRHIKVYLEDWAYLPAFDGTKEFKPAGTTELSCAKWISFVPDDFIIPAFGKQTINYTVRVPQDAKGGHYAVMFFENNLSEQNTPQEGVSVGVAIRIASLFYIEPEGTIIKEAAIQDVKVKKRQGGFEVTAKLVNKGNTDIIAKGNFFAMDKNGIVQARGQFNDIYMFGGNTAVLSGVWKNPLPAGDYDLVLSVDIGGAEEELGLGRGPVVTEENKIHVDSEGNIRVGEKG